MNMLVYRVTCFANAADVCMTMVGGRVLSFGENAVLERVNEVAELMIERSGLRHLLDEPTTRWGRSHYRSDRSLCRRRLAREGFVSVGQRDIADGCPSADMLGFLPNYSGDCYAVHLRKR
ncbi:hypothetical protein [Burkholderia sp. BE17]|uniref:hypothetical protein n=1 Tax=Burkholderia sp. BE17 TaxID=2656644 RepID=UPI001D102132|nr:hypothetical protein [Burkholderia sp. BE17]